MKQSHFAILIVALLICTAGRTLAGDTHGGGPTSGRIKGPLPPQAQLADSSAAWADPSRGFYQAGLPDLSEYSEPPDPYSSYARRKEPPSAGFLRPRILSLALYLMIFGDYPFY